MNYEFWWDCAPWGVDDIPIGHVFRDEWQRPTVGIQLKIKGKLVVVTRTDPTSNSATAAVKYYVSEVNGNKPYMLKK